MRVTIFVFCTISLAACMHGEIESTVSIGRLRIQAQERFAQHEYDAAIELFEELSSATTLTLQDQYTLGRSYYFLDQYHKADSIFGCMQGKNPQSNVTLLWRARSNAAIDSTAENGLAFPYFKRLAEDLSIKARPQEIREALHYLVYYYYVKKDYDQMKLCMKKMITLFPRDEQLQSILHDIDHLVTKQ